MRTDPATVTAGAPAPSEAAAASTARPSRFEYVPALDGLRAAALLGMMLYHAGVTWFAGGVLTVSTFFTLSGFLITRLLLAELGTTGGIALGRFYGQRFRRLMPAALVTLIGIVLVWNVFGAGARPVARGDALSSLAYVANWWSIAIDRSYAELFGAASPVQHFWSLSIEEQFYLVFPLLIVAVARLVRRPDRVVGVLGMVMVACFALGGLLARGDGASRAYYGTGARAAEFLAGAVLAGVLARPGAARWARVVAARGTAKAAAVAAFVMLVAGWALVTYRSPTLFPWGVGLNAALTCVVLVAVLGRGPVTSVLSIAPLVALGRISYGVYLLHWPVFLLLTTASTGLSGWLLLTARFGVTFVLAAVMSVLIEQPIRHRRFLAGPQAWVAGIAATALVLALLALPAPVPPASAFDHRAMADARARVLRPPPIGDGVASPTPQPPSPAGLSAAPPPAAPSPASPASVATPTAELVAITGLAVEPSPAAQDTGAASIGAEQAAAAELAGSPPEAATRARRVLVVGDSIAWTVASGLRGWGAEHGMQIEVFHAVGCGLAGDTPIRYLGVRRTQSADCGSWMRDLPTAIDLYRPGAVLVVGGMADLSDRALPDGAWAHIGEPPYDGWLEGRQRALVDILAAHGAVVGWATLPHLRAPYQPGLTGRPPFAENDPARADRLNDLVVALASSDPRVTVVDFATLSRSQPGGEFDPSFRPDGVHLGAESSRLVAPWFGDRLEELLAR